MQHTAQQDRVHWTPCSACRIASDFCQRVVLAGIRPDTVLTGLSRIRSPRLSIRTAARTDGSMVLRGTGSHGSLQSLTAWAGLIGGMTRANAMNAPLSRARRTRWDWLRHHYEFIRENSACRLYFDLEFARECNPAHLGPRMCVPYLPYRRFAPAPSGYRGYPVPTRPSRRRETLMDHVRAQLEEDGVILAGLGPLKVRSYPMRRHCSCRVVHATCRVVRCAAHFMLRRAILIIVCGALTPRGSACCWSRRTLRSTASTSSCTSRATPSSTTMCRWDFSLPGCSRGHPLSQPTD